MKKQFFHFIGMLLTVFSVGSGVFVQAEERVYDRRENYIDLATLPAEELHIGTSGRIRPKKDSILKDFEYAFLYSTSDPSILSIDEKGNWQAHKTGTVSIFVRQHDMQSYMDTPTFKEEFDHHGLIWYSSGNVDPSISSAEASVQVKVVDSPVRPVPIQLYAVYRLYHPDLQVHLYTKDKHENDVLATRGWRAEGIAWYTQTEFGQPVYRLYNDGLKVHLYTKDQQEYQILSTRGWNQEGVAYLSSGSTPVYRLYHPGIKKHLFTKDSHERDVLSQRGWHYEGVAWNVD